MRKTFCTIVSLLLLGGAAHADPSALPGGGPRKTIAVGGFEQGEGGAASADGLSAMLTAALLKDPHFVVVERQAMPQLQWEQQAAGAMQPGSTPQSGQLLGASVLVRGTVTKFDPHAGGGGVSLGGFNVFGSNAGSLGVGGQTAVVEVSLRLIDTTTGRVIASSSARGTSASKGFDVALYQRRGFSIGANGFSETPMGQACQQAIDAAVKQIDSGMERVPWNSAVVENTGDRIYVAGGVDENLQVGTRLKVYRKLRDITDLSGAVLETITQPVATIELREVHDTVSVAAMVDGSPPLRGDLVKVE